MSIYKRVSGNLVVTTLGNTDSVTFQGLTANTATVIIDGDLTVTGNASLTGNIAGDKIFNGTTSIEIPVPSGNISMSVGGVSNVMVVTSTGTTFAGAIGFTGNVSAGNLATPGVVSATGNVLGGNIVTVGNITLSRASTATTAPVIRFSDSNTAVTSLGANIGAVEWFTSDATGGGARVTAAVKAVYSDGSGNANILIQSANSSGALVNRITVQGATGRVGVGNNAPLHTLAVSGTIYGSSTLDVVGNITGGNASVTGLVSAGGNVTGGNIRTAGLVSAGGNITGANLSVTGGLVGGAGGVSVTGNITGGNLIINGAMSASGNLATTNITATTVSATGNVTGGNIKTLGISNVGTSIVTATQTVIGNITGANVNTGIVSATGNIIGLNVNTGLVSATGNVVSAAGGFFIGDGGFLSNITVVSNVAVTQLASGISNWTIRGPGGSITGDVGGSANVAILSSTGFSVTGFLSAVGNVVAGNIVTAGQSLVTGNITGGNVSAATGTFTTVIGAANASNLTSGTVPSDRLTGQYTININGSAVTANTVTVAAQPNITSVGNLSGLTVTGNVTAGNFVGTLNGSGANVTSINATNITTGTIAAARIPGLDAGKITTGTFADARIPNLAATKITSGILAAARLSGAYSISVTSAGTAGTVTTAAQPTITSVGTLTALAVTGNVTAGNFVGTLNGSGANVTAINGTNITSGTVAAARIAALDAAKVTTGVFADARIPDLNASKITAGTLAAARLSGAYPISVTLATTAIRAATVTTAAQPNITSVGTLSSLAVTANVTLGNIVNANGNGVGNIGSLALFFNTVFAKATSAQYADLAEKFLADQLYAPGTVLIFGGNQEVTQSVIDQDHRVAGVVSTNPGYVMNSGLSGNYVVDLALQGRVPCSVVGPVQKGDLMVSAADGRARAVKNAPAGTIIGKSLENFAGTAGTIEIVVGRD